MCAKTLIKPLLIFSLCTPFLAHAEFGFYAKGGTLGLGGGVGYGISDMLTARVGYTAYNLDRDIDSTDVDYEGKFKLGGAEALLDWHPFAGTFRVTGGLIFSRNKIDVDAKLNQSVTINDVEYDAGDLGDLSGTVKFKSTTPYLGIGWGNVVGKNGNFHLVADIGFQYLGTPHVKLNASCSTQGAISAPVECLQLDQNVQAEEDDLNDEVENYEWWPVLSIGVAYRF
jgi:hypothetical protein